MASRIQGKVVVTRDIYPEGIAYLKERSVAARREMGSETGERRGERGREGGREDAGLWTAVSNTDP